MEQLSKTQIITIAGRPGSGKSTAAKAIAKKLEFEHFSSGDLFRQLAKEQRIDVLQANLSAEEEDEIPKIDQLVDDTLKTIGKTKNKIVIDSRMAWHWMPRSFKVFLDLDLETAASRILSKMTHERIEAEHIPEDPNEYAKVLQKRLDSEARRYQKIYNADPYNIENYDLVINTGTHSIDQVIELIVSDFTSLR